MEVTATAWVVTIAVIVLLLGVDLAVGALRPHAVGFAEATAWSVFYIAVALAFGVVLGLVAGWELGGQYFAGYLVEKSLSVDNLAMAGQAAAAHRLFERLLGHANDLGLLAEEIDPASGELLGNFPQAFSHVGLISAAINLQRGRRTPEPRPLAGSR